MSAKLMDLWCAASKGVGLSHQRTVAKYRGKWGTPIRLLDGQEATMLGCGGLYGACHDYHNVGAYLLFGGLMQIEAPTRNRRAVTNSWLRGRHLQTENLVGYRMASLLDQSLTCLVTFWVFLLLGGVREPHLARDECR